MISRIVRHYIMDKLKDMEPYITDLRDHSSPYNHSKFDGCDCESNIDDLPPHMLARLKHMRVLADYLDLRIRSLINKVDNEDRTFDEKQSEDDFLD